MKLLTKSAILMGCLLYGCTHSRKQLHPSSTRTAPPQTTSRAPYHMRPPTAIPTKSTHSTFFQDAHHTPILGTPRCTASQMQWFLLTKRPHIKRQYLNLPALYLEEGAKEGVRGDLAFAQAILETNYFNFNGEVAAHKNNFAGIGAIGANESRISTFKTPREGVRAHIQLLKTYATTTPCVQPYIKPHFMGNKFRGRAPFIEDLAGKWAIPGYRTNKYASLEEAKKNHASYGDRIRIICNQMCKMQIPKKLPIASQPHSTCSQ